MKAINGLLESLQSQGADDYHENTHSVLNIMDPPRAEYRHRIHIALQVASFWISYLCEYLQVLIKQVMFCVVPLNPDYTLLVTAVLSSDLHIRADGSSFIFLSNEMGFD